MQVLLFLFCFFNSFFNLFKSSRDKFTTMIINQLLQWNGCVFHFQQTYFAHLLDKHADDELENGEVVR